MSQRECGNLAILFRENCCNDVLSVAILAVKQFKNVMKSENITFLYRPVNQAELDLIEQSGWSKFPPRLPEQPIFYPVINETYAIQISKEWNVPAYGVGYVTKFAVKTDYLKKFNIENVGGQTHDELWIPSEELEEFNANIVGQIEVTKEFRNE